MKVILIKGKDRQKEWDDPNSKRAWQRAYALADLHNATIDPDKDGRLIVNATEYYSK